MREVLIRTADAGDTYLSWTWLHGTRAPQAARRPAEELNPVLAKLNEGLLLAEFVDTSDGDVGSSALTDARLRVLGGGHFSNLDSESRLCRELTTAVVPTDLQDQILQAHTEGHPLRVRVTPSPRLSRVPWETLVLRGDKRLIDVAQVVLDPPATIYAERAKQPDRWHDVAPEPVLQVVDPKLSEQRHQLLTDASRACFASRLEKLRGQARALLDDPEPGSDVTRDRLSFALTDQRRSRLFYFGHISSDADEPGTAALHLSDTPDMCWGFSSPIVGNTPLSALDLLLGTSTCSDADVWRRYASRRQQYGHEIWPMPSRVALIACEGGVDFRSAETFGLVVAILNAGAELVTTTRWPLPTDHAFHRLGVDETELPTTELALEVDAAHDTDDPVVAVRDWQLERLRLWHEHPTDIRYSPILWAALTHTCAPRRDS